MSLGETISQLRKEAGFTQGELAEACNLSQTYLSQIEKGKKEPTWTSLNKISDVLGVPLPVLVFLTIREENIPEKKREAFNMLFPSIKGFLIELFPKSAGLVNK